VPPEARPEEQNAGQQSLVALKLCFQAQALNRLYDYFDDSFIIQNGDGSFTLEIALPEGEWLYSYILSFGSFVKVIAPENVRKIIAHRIRQALKLYE